MKIEDIIKDFPNINITVNAGDLLEFAKSIATRTANEFLEKQKEKVYSRTEVIEIFKICSATLWRWSKFGLIQSKKIGNRRYYAESELKRLMGSKGLNLCK